ncbi:hypothetical protein CfE428DRAFT_1319 [Chthoniobacter flavus Ellin428]|uniref:Butirosin biosynthesis protein H N-terminal domain-containing protein n=1 Tax=Chthoniobacter flavus Ellin428 TaxID=497964 RepID=B4CXM8_9BACT|nr:hypothetical protein [Chthoniobacter flavus]EDY21026.1 hypothetical protein CfE428DRAFT_1319 [Chthoniobacter flavus Ellin428]TCO88751.1 hypothetical protein EV701_116123 [Chthoniobacter flavus]
MNGAPESNERNPWIEGALSLRQLSYGCHVLAAFQLMPELEELLSATELAGLTGLCFGLSHVDRDRARQLVPSVSPLPALSSALGALGIASSLKHWGEQEGDAAYRDLAVQTERRPTLVGPLDMGLLFHNPSALVYRGLDHMLVALEVHEHEILVTDSEGFPAVVIPREEFLTAWRAISVPESHRSFNSLCVDRVSPFRDEERERAHLREALLAQRPASSAHVAAIIQRISASQSEDEGSGLELNLAALLERASCTLQITYYFSDGDWATISEALLELVATLGGILGPPLAPGRRMAALKGVARYFDRLCAV